jgi:hypothetical protein
MQDVEHVKYILWELYSTYGVTLVKYFNSIHWIGSQCVLRFRYMQRFNILLLKGVLCRMRSSWSLVSSSNITMDSEEDSWLASIFQQSSIAIARSRSVNTETVGKITTIEHSIDWTLSRGRKLHRRLLSEQRIWCSQIECRLLSFLVSILNSAPLNSYLS